MRLLKPGKSAYFRISALVVFAMLSSYPCSALESSLSVQYRVSESQRVLEEFIDYLNRVSGDKIAAESEVLILIPNATKQSYVFKGQHGEGVMLRRRDNGSWSGPAFISLFGKSSDWGSAEPTSDLVMVVSDITGADPFLKHRFTLGTDIRSEAGRITESDAFPHDSPVRTFLRKGETFAGVDLNGSVIQEDLEANKVYYRQSLTSRDLLLGQNPSRDSDSASFAGIMTRMNGFPEFEQTMQRVE